MTTAYGIKGRWLKIHGLRNNDVFFLSSKIVLEGYSMPPAVLHFSCTSKLTSLKLINFQFSFECALKEKKKWTYHDDPLY